MYKAEPTDFNYKAATEHRKLNYSSIKVHSLLEIFQHKCGRVNSKQNCTVCLHTVENHKQKTTIWKHYFSQSVSAACLSVFTPLAVALPAL